MRSLIESSNRLLGSFWSDIQGRYDSQIRPKWKNRRLFTTCQGHVGLGPGASKAGDVIANITSAWLLVVLRPHAYILGVHDLFSNNDGSERYQGRYFDIS